MSLPLWVFSVLERIDLRQAGNIVVPYSIVLEGGNITAAYHTITEHGSKNNTTATNHTTTGTTGAASTSLTATGKHNVGKGSSGNNKSLAEAGATHEAPRGPVQSFRHIYDCGLQTVLHGLTIVDEALEMEQRHTARATEIVSMLVEKVPPQESRRAQKDTHSLLAVEYLCPQHTLNVLCRGASHLYPQSRSDTEASLREHLHATHQEQITSHLRERSGLLQRFDSMGEEFTTGVMVRWVRHEATTIIIPTCDDDRRRVSLDVECRQSKTSVKDRLAFPYQKCATVDGMKVLSVSVAPIPSAVEDAVLKASAVILGEMNGEAQSVVSAVLMFRVGRQPAAATSTTAAAALPPNSSKRTTGGTTLAVSTGSGSGGGGHNASSLTSSNTAALPLVQFLYAAFAEMKTDVMVHPPLGFAIPAQYRYKKGGRPRPRSVHIYEEDLIQDVLPSAVNSPPRSRATQAKQHSLTPNEVAPASPGRAAPMPLPQNGGGLEGCVDDVLAQPQFMILPRGSAKTDASVVDLMFEQQTDELYERLEQEISGIDPNHHSGDGSSADNLSDGSRSHSPRLKKKKTNSPTSFCAPKLQRKLSRAEKSVLECRQAQRDKERIATTMLRMMQQDIPAHFNERAAKVLRLSKKETSLVKKMARSASTAASSGTPSNTLRGDLTMFGDSQEKKLSTTTSANTHRVGAKHSSSFVVDACQYSVAGASAEKKEWFRSGASIAQDGVKHHHRFTSSSTPLLERRGVHHYESAAMVDWSNGGGGERPRSQSALGVLHGSTSPARAITTSQRSDAILHNPNGGGHVSPPSSPSSRSSARRSPIATPSRPTSPTNGDAQGRPELTAASGNVADDAQMPEALVPKGDEEEGDNDFDEDGLVLLSLAEAAPERFVAAVDLLCVDHLDREPTTMEFLQFFVRYVHCYYGTSQLPTTGDSSADALDILQRVVLAAAEYCESIWYQLDGQALLVNPTFARSVAAKLRSREPQSFQELAGIFSMSIVREVVDQHIRAASAPTPAAAQMLPNCRDSVVHVGDGDALAPAPPAWGGEVTVQSHQPLAAASRSEEEDTTAAVSQYNEDASNQIVNAATQETAAAAAEETAPMVLSANDAVSEQEEEVVDNANAIQATSTEGPLPPTAEVAVVPLIADDVVVEKAVVSDEVRAASPPPPASIHEADDKLRGVSQAAAPTTTLDGLPLHLLLAVDTALHQFLVSIGGVREFVDDNDERLLGKGRGGRSQLASSVLPMSILQDAVSECTGAEVGTMPIVPVEERFAGWLQTGKRSSSMSADDEERFGGLHVYAVPIGSVPPLADADQRTAHWILGPLRKLFLSLWVDMTHENTRQ